MGIPDSMKREGLYTLSVRSDIEAAPPSATTTISIFGCVKD